MDRGACNGSHRRWSPSDLGRANRACGLLACAPFGACVRRPTPSFGSDDAAIAPSPEDAGDGGSEQRDDAIVEEGSSEEGSSSTTQSDADATFDAGDVDPDGDASASGGDADAPPDGACWSLPIVTRARIFPAPGGAAALVNGKIMGSTT